MKFFLLFFAVLTVCTAKATNYYFSTLTGDDGRSSLQAQSPASPWKTLDKLNSIFGGLQPGDSLLLKRGDTFYGSIAVTKSGTAALPIVVAAYGTGNKPVITGFATLSNWSVSGESIQGSTSSLLGAKVNTVIINNVAYAMGRYPNSDAAARGYLTYESSVGNTQIIDNELTAATNWTGAEVVIRKVHGVLDRNLITAHLGNTLSYATGSTYTPSANFGYFIQNDIRTLDKFGEWYYNPLAKKLNVYFAGSSPSAYDVKASAVGTLINLNSQSNVVFYNLAVTGANVDGFRINGAQNINIKACDVSFSGENGIKASYTSYLKVEDCSVAYSNNNGIDLAYNNDYAVLQNNRIENTCIFAGMGTSGDGNGTGINSRGKANILEYNQIINTGYNGIAFAEDDAVIKNNFINNFCFIKDDGGGIYTYVGGNAVAPRGRKITGNVILNGLGAGPGTNDTTFQAANGIFLDDNTSGVEIKDNTVANSAHFGIFFHNAHDIVLHNNTFFNNKAQLMMRSSEQVAGSVANNDVTNNIFYSKTATQMVSHLISARNDIDNFARFDSNYYCRPLDDRLTIENDLLYNYGNNTKSDVFDLDGWKVKYGKDASAKKSPVQVPAYTINNLNGTNKFTNGSFNTDIGYVNCWTPLGNCNTSWNSGGKLDGGAMQIGFSSPTGSYDVATTSLPVGSISNSKNYILRFSLLGALNGKSLAVYLRDNNLYSKLTPVKYVKISTSRTENEILFSLPVSAGNAGLLFEVNDQFNTVWVDNVQLSEADVTATNPDNYIRFEANPDKVAKTISLDALYVDVKNNSYSTTVTLPPFSSLVLVKSNVLLSQNISFAPLSNKTYGDPAFALSATASSGLPVSFRVVSGPATVSGNTLTLTGTGTVTIEASQAGNPTYNPALVITQSFSVAAPASAACSATGSISYEQWNNLPGWAIATIPLQTIPNNTRQLTSFESQDVGQLYGVRIRGYVCPPQSGAYTFWIAGDDVLELWLSTDDNPANKVKICNTNYTVFREWNKYPSQKSALVSLQSGTRYYIEVLHKEGGGGGHSSVAWTLPSGVFQGPVPGSQLSPYVQTLSQNIAFGPLANKTFGDPSFVLSAAASSGLAVSFRVASGPATVSGNTLTLSGVGTVAVEASQPGNGIYGAAPAVIQSFTVAASVTCSAIGTILYEKWNNLPGWALASIPLQTTPNSTAQLLSLESQDVGQLYGVRISGYVCPPQNGAYMFWLSGDDVLELWLSTDDNPANKVKICNTNYTMFREWNKYPSQKSGSITLQAGKRYYIEVLQKEGGGGGHSSVGWTLPDGTFQGPIPGTVLSPFVAQLITSSSPANSITDEINTGAFSNQEESVLFAYPNPFKTDAMVQFSSNKSGRVSLEVFDVHGKLVKTLFRGDVKAKVLKNARLNAEGLKAGTYVLRMITKEAIINRKMVLVN